MKQSYAQLTGIILFDQWRNGLNGAALLDYPQGAAYLTASQVEGFAREFRGGVAQLVRALPCHGRGRGFESRRSRQFPGKPVLRDN